jgi:hypothetical protein
MQVIRAMAMTLTRDIIISIISTRPGSIGTSRRRNVIKEEPPSLGRSDPQRLTALTPGRTAPTIATTVHAVQQMLTNFQL